MQKDGKSQSKSRKKHKSKENDKTLAKEQNIVPSKAIEADLKPTKKSKVEIKSENQALLQRVHELTQQNMEILNAFKILREQHSIPENLSTNEEQETQILQKQSKKDSIHGSGKPSKVQVKIRGISSQSKKKTNDKYSQNFSSHDPSVQFKHHQSMIN